MSDGLIVVDTETVIDSVMQEFGGPDQDYVKSILEEMGVTVHVDSRVDESLYGGGVTPREVEEAVIHAMTVAGRHDGCCPAWGDHGWLVNTVAPEIGVSPWVVVDSVADPGYMPKIMFHSEGVLFLRPPMSPGALEDVVPLHTADTVKPALQILLRWRQWQLTNEKEDDDEG